MLAVANVEPLIFHVPWPVVAGSINFKTSTEFESNGSVEEHMMAQFDCRSLNLERRFLKNPAPSALNEVREIVRAIFYSFCHNSFFLFSVRARSPPIRFTAKGTPLLLVAVIDHQLV